MAGIKHQFTSAIGDGGDATLVRPSDWNAEHLLGGSVKFDAATSFPGSPTADDLCYRTDRNIIYFYDGTRWLSTTLYHLPIPIANIVQPYSANQDGSMRVSVWNGIYDLWLENWYAESFVATTNNGTNFWTCELFKETHDAAYAETSLGSFTTSADTITRFISHEVTIGALLGTSYAGVNVSVTKTLTPGTLSLSSAVTYRLVG